MNGTLLNVARKQTQNAFERLVETRQSVKPPFLANEYAALLGIESIREDLGELDALLLPMKDGYRIKVNEKHHPVRQNFSCAHEIGHLILNRIINESQIAVPKFRSVNASGEAHFAEKLCNRIAAELLMPELPFRNALLSLGASVTSISSLAKIFYTSVLATAIRIAEMCPEPCIALYWRKAQRRGWRKEKPCLILAVDNADELELPSSPYGIPKLIAPKPNSSVSRALETNLMVGGFESFPLGSVARPFYIESKAFGRDPRYVISLVFPDRKKHTSLASKPASMRSAN
ncbi:MAG: ImmA/IrrE family metallo-endopeptidase [Chloroflexi bacterium]|nr:ImmA/IrrE family metallo-endopeptidase [Chloroflexota bacterium]